MKSALNIHWKDWCWSWYSSTLATWCDVLTHWKRPWCWERLKAEGEGDDRGWDVWIASLTQWTWVWATPGVGMTREACHLVVHGVSESQTWLSDWTELKIDWFDLLAVQGALGQLLNKIRVIKCAKYSEIFHLLFSNQSSPPPVTENREFYVTFWMNHSTMSSKFEN